MRAPFSSTLPRGARARWAGVVTAGLLASSAAGAQAAHWPGFGGDVGHSGLQTSEPPATPLGLKWSQAGDVVTPPLITGGTADTRRVVYGTADGTVYVRNLSTGALVGTPANFDLAPDDPDTFTGLANGSVGFVDASDEGAPGNVFILRNEDVATGNDISLAWINTATGTAHDVGLSEVNSLLGGYTISSSPVLTPPDSNGNRILYFIASGGASQQLRHLYRLPIGAANSATPVIDASQLTRSPREPNPDPNLPDIVPDINANQWSSPTIVYDDAGVEWVVVGTTDGFLQAYRTDDNAFAGGQRLQVDVLDDDPDNTAPETPAWDLATPVVPSGPSGEIPGRNGYPAAPHFYVAHNRGLFAHRPPYVAPEVPTDNTSITTILIGSGAAPFSVGTTSPSAVASGYPGTSIAVTQTVAANGSLSSGRLIVPNNAGVAVVNADTLTRVGSGSAGAAIANAPAAGGGYGFVSKDDGTQVVLDLATGNPVGASDFSDGGPAGTTVGAPALAGGYVVFAGSGGIAAYRQTSPAGSPGPGGGGTTPPPAGGGGTTPPPSGGGGGGATDTTDPRVTLTLGSRQRGVSRRKVTLKVRCNEACSIRVTGAFSGVRTRGVRKSARGRANSTVTVNLSLTRSQRNAIRSALRRGRRVSLRLTIVATDAAGNATTARRTIRVTG